MVPTVSTKLASWKLSVYSVAKNLSLPVNQLFGQLIVLSNNKENASTSLYWFHLRVMFLVQWLYLKAALPLAKRFLQCHLIITIQTPAADPCNFTQWASCQIRKIAGAHAPGMPGTFSPSPRVSDPDIHHGTCVTHVPWCISGSLTSGFLWNRRRGKTFPAFPAHAQPAILRIW